MYTSTSYSGTGSAQGLADYLSKNQKSRQPNVYDAGGRRLTRGELADWVDHADGEGPRRSIVFSTAPDNQLLDEGIHHHTRSVMNEYVAEKPSVSYVYSIHHDTDKIHAHVAMSGDRRDLWQDPQELRELKVKGELQFRGPDHAHALAQTLDVNAQEIGIESPEERGQDPHDQRDIWRELLVDRDVEFAEEAEHDPEIEYWKRQLREMEHEERHEEKHEQESEYDDEIPEIEAEILNTEQPFRTISEDFEELDQSFRTMREELEEIEAEIQELDQAARDQQQAREPETGHEPEERHEKAWTRYDDRERVEDIDAIDWDQRHREESERYTDDGHIEPEAARDHLDRRNPHFYTQIRQAGRERLADWERSLRDRFGDARERFGNEFHELHSRFSESEWEKHGYESEEAYRRGKALGEVNPEPVVGHAPDWELHGQYDDDWEEVREEYRETLFDDDHGPETLEEIREQIQEHDHSERGQEQIWRGGSSRTEAWQQDLQDRFDHARDRLGHGQQRDEFEEDELRADLEQKLDGMEDWEREAYLAEIRPGEEQIEAARKTFREEHHHEPDSDGHDRGEQREQEPTQDADAGRGLWR